MNNIKIFFRTIAIPVIVGIVVGIITAPTMDYSMLQKPALAPPGVLFPVVWTILYVLMGISYGILESNNLVDEKVKSIYFWQLLVNALWSIIFFVLKWRFFAFIWIIILIILVISMIQEFYKRNKISGLLQFPYLAWIVFAAYLNFAFFILNR